MDKNNPPKGGTAEIRPCVHKWVLMETVRQRGERASFGISSAKEWKRIDRFYCEKCLEIKEIVKREVGWEDKPVWFD